MIGWTRRVLVDKHHSTAAMERNALRPLMADSCRRCFRSADIATCVCFRNKR